MASLPECILRRGFKDSPLCLFIHGLGMDMNIWAEPEKTRILAGSFPLTVLLSEGPPEPPEGEASLKDYITTGRQPRSPKTSFHDLMKEGYTVMAYSQRRPATDCMTLVEELGLLLDRHGRIAARGVVLIAHSRGGLVARKAVELLDLRCIGLVTLSTPHSGSSLARLAGMLSGFSKVLYPFFMNAEIGTVRGVLRRVTEFLKSEAIRELLPGSAFIRSLDDEVLRGVKGLSMGGTDPALFTLYRWRKGSYEKMLSIPDILVSFLPEEMVPEELLKGKGDGLVSAGSSVIPHAVEHHNHPLNHAKIIFDPEVRRKIREFVSDL